MFIRCIGAMWVSALLCGTAIAQQPVERGAGQPTTGPAAAPAFVPPRDQFLAVETFARLSPDAQQRELPRFYQGLTLRLMSRMMEGLSSSLPPENLFARDPRPQPGQTINTNARLESYGAQLDAHVADMTPEQVADTIDATHHSMILEIAARRRAIYVLQKNRTELKKLLDADLAADDRTAVRRALNIIQALDLTEYFERVLALYLGNGPFAEDARMALFSGTMDPRTTDPRLVKAVLDDIQQHPSSIKRHGVLLTMPLRKQPAPPEIIRLLESPDAEIRLSAAGAITETGDPVLADYVPKLLVDPDPTVRDTAILMAFLLTDQAYTKVRPSLLQCMATDTQKLRVQVAFGLAGRKDAAAAPVLLEMMNQPAMDPQSAVLISQSLSKLTGRSLNYDIHNWGPANPRNARPIAEFEQWIAANTKQTD